MSTFNLYIMFNILFWIIVITEILHDINLLNQLKSKNHATSSNPWPWFNAALLFAGAACLATTPNEPQLIRIISASCMLIAAVSTAFRTKRVLKKQTNQQSVPSNYRYWRYTDVGMCVMAIIALMF